MKSNNNSNLTSICIIISCCMLGVSLILLTITSILNFKNQTDLPQEPSYVFVMDEQYDIPPQKAPSDGWVVKAYDKKIGIFHKDGSLLFILDTYIKTLPKADIDLLREGIFANDSIELAKLIEAYSD